MSNVYSILGISLCKAAGFGHPLAVAMVDPS
jgi:hypothetical protein